MIHNFINLDKWNELPPAYKSIIRTASSMANEWMQARYDAANPAALKRLVAGGAQLRPFSQPIMDASLRAALDLYAKVYGAAVEKDSGGRIKVEIYPASQLGAIPRQIEGTQFGAIQCAVIPPEFFVGVDERFEVLAAPGLVTSAAQGHRVAADPAVQVGRDRPVVVGERWLWRDRSQPPRKSCPIGRDWFQDSGQASFDATQFARVNSLTWASV